VKLVGYICLSINCFLLSERKFICPLLFQKISEESPSDTTYIVLSFQLQGYQGIIDPYLFPFKSKSTYLRDTIIIFQTGSSPVHRDSQANTLLCALSVLRIYKTKGATIAIGRNNIKEVRGF